MLSSSSSCALKLLKSSSSVSELKSLGKPLLAHTFSFSLCRSQCHFHIEANVPLKLCWSLQNSPAFWNPLVILFFFIHHACRDPLADVGNGCSSQSSLWMISLPLLIQGSRSPWWAAVTARFTLMSSGCKYFVEPPEITSGIEFVLLMAAFTESVTWTLTKTKKIFLFLGEIILGAHRSTLLTIRSFCFQSSTLSCWFSRLCLSGVFYSHPLKTHHW